MNISLTPEQEAMVRDKVESGLYNNASEVVREAIRRMHEDECRLSVAQRRELSERFDLALRAGMKEVEEGKTVPFTRELFEQIVKNGRALAASGAPLDPDVAPRD